jgi:hypothetical protein
MSIVYKLVLHFIFRKLSKRWFSRTDECSARFMMNSIDYGTEYIYFALGATYFRKQQNGLAAYECIYEEGICLFDDLSDSEFKKLIQKQYNYIKQIAKERFYYDISLTMFCEAYIICFIAYKVMG